MQNSLFIALMLYINNRCLVQYIGISYVGAATLPVCHIQSQKKHENHELN